MQSLSAMQAVYPVHYRVAQPAHFTRFQLGTRVVAFLVLGVVGLSFGTLFLCAYLGLPLLAATRLARGREAYLRDDAPRIVAALRWFAAVSAWAGLVAEELPHDAPDETVRIDVDVASHATPRSALWRIVAGIPSALAFGFLSWIGMLVWVWAVLSILVVQRVGAHTFAYLTGLQRWSIRLLAYQASLVDAYPPFAFSEAPTSMSPATT